MQTIESLCEELGQLIVESYANFNTWTAKNVAEGKFKIEFDVGRKYIKIVQNDGQRSVHAFVDKSNGDLYKAESWAKPAKGVRYNLLKDMEILRKRVDWAGGYLYAR